MYIWKNYKHFTSAKEELTLFKYAYIILHNYDRGREREREKESERDNERKNEREKEREREIEIGR